MKSNRKKKKTINLKLKLIKRQKGSELKPKKKQSLKINIFFITSSWSKEKKNLFLFLES
jgi:hypothetical protein